MLELPVASCPPGLGIALDLPGIPGSPQAPTSLSIVPNINTTLAMPLQNSMPLEHACPKEHLYIKYERCTYRKMANV